MRPKVIIPFLFLCFEVRMMANSWRTRMEHPGWEFFAAVQVASPHPASTTTNACHFCCTLLLPAVFIRYHSATSQRANANANISVSNILFLGYLCHVVQSPKTRLSHPAGPPDCTAWHSNLNTGSHRNLPGLNVPCPWVVSTAGFCQALDGFISCLGLIDVKTTQLAPPDVAVRVLAPNEPALN